MRIIVCVYSFERVVHDFRKCVSAVEEKTVIDLINICVGRYSLEKSVIILDQNK